MNRRGRALVLALSLAIVLFAAVGGFMSRAMAAREESNSYEHLRIFEDVVSLITSNYVEEVDVDKVMHGAMHGLADGLDPDSAYLNETQVAQFESAATPATGETGLELTRQYYLRVIAARDGSPAARAGLQPGDYIRGIDGQSTRDTSVFEGTRLLRGKPGTKVRLTVLRGNAADPHDVELTRETLPALAVTGRIAAPGTGYLRVPEFAAATATQLKSEIAALQKAGATQLIVDLRGNAFGEVEVGLAAARQFVTTGTLAFRQDRGKEKEPIAAATADATRHPADGHPHRQRHGRRGGAVRGRAPGQQARGDHRRADPRPGRAPEAGEAPGRQRAPAHASLLSAAWRRRHSREGPRTRCRRRAADPGLRPDAADRRPDPREGPRTRAEKKAA